jgi:membrane protease YdiL (CAAX protease family)
MPRTPGWWPIGVIVTVLVVANVVSNRVLTFGWYVPWAVTCSAVLLALAVRVDGRSWTELGLARHQVPGGLRWGAALAGSVFAVYLMAALMPATRELFEDERVQGWTLAETLLAAFYRVPFGTVLLEEVAFRGVLPAVLAVRRGKVTAIVISALLFGLWHVLPALGLGDTNPVAEDSVGQLPEWVTVVGAVASTAAVGVFFSWLKERSGSLLTPMALHWSTNGLGYLFAYWAWNAA